MNRENRRGFQRVMIVLVKTQKHHELNFDGKNL